MKTTKKEALKFIEGAEENINTLRTVIDNTEGNGVDVSGLVICCDESNGKTACSVFGTGSDICSSIANLFHDDPDEVRSLKALKMYLDTRILRLSMTASDEE